MQDPSHRFVVIISALLTLLVLGGATLAVGPALAGYTSQRMPRAETP